MARLAKSLETLRSQVDKEWPKRNKASDGWLGDAAHAAVASDHNPNSAGVVTALDLTNHPGYFDAHKMADRLIRLRHPNLKYIISNRRIAGAWSGWRWQAYNGANPHDKHIHVSVGTGPDGQSKPPYDSTVKWNIKAKEKEMVTLNGLNVIYRFLLARPATEYGIKTYQGKVTFDEAYKKVKDSDTYKKHVEEHKKEDKDAVKHLPKELRA